MQVQFSMLFVDNRQYYRNMGFWQTMAVIYWLRINTCKLVLRLNSSSCSLIRNSLHCYGDLHLLLASWGPLG